MSAAHAEILDKIASITQALALKHDLRIEDENIPSEEGVVLVVEVLTNKSTYNTLELTSGRMAKVVRGDIVVGALGTRKALFGYSGHVPESIKAGDIITSVDGQPVADATSLIVVIRSHVPASAAPTATSPRRCAARRVRG